LRIFAAILGLLAGFGISTPQAGFRSPESLVRNLYAYYGDRSSTLSSGLLAGAFGFYESPKRTGLLRATRMSPPRQAGVVVENPPGDGVTAAIGGTLGRIVMLQVASIIGGMLARSYGTTAPWLT
jgi:hypothetical protein